MATGSLDAILFSDSDRSVLAECRPAQPTEAQDESLRIETERWKPAEVDWQPLETAPADREQALLSVDSALSNLSPLIVADLHNSDPRKRMSALFAVSRSGAQEGFSVITRSFDDPSPDVSNSAALALRELEPRRTADLFSQASETASPERSRNIGNAMVASGLAAEAIDDLSGEDREHAYNALSLLFVMAKISVVQPLVQAIEEHESIKVRGAALRLLSLSGQSEIAEAAVKRRLRI